MINLIDRVDELEDSQRQLAFICDSISAIKANKLSVNDFVVILPRILFKNADLDNQILSCLQTNPSKDLFSTRKEDLIISIFEPHAHLNHLHLTFIHKLFIGNLDLLTLKTFRLLLQKILSSKFNSETELLRISAICTLIYADFHYLDDFSSLIIDEFCDPLLANLSNALSASLKTHDRHQSIESCRCLLQLSLHSLNKKPQNELFDKHAHEIISNIWTLIKDISKESCPTNTFSSEEASKTSDSQQQDQNKSNNGSQKRVILCTTLVKRFQSSCRVNVKIKNFRIFMPFNMHFSEMNLDDFTLCHERMIRHPDLLTHIYLERDQKFRESLYKLFLEITFRINSLFSMSLEDSRYYNRPFISFSQCLAMELRLLHKRICFLLLSERKFHLILLALKSLNHIISLTPYQRLIPGLIKGLILPTLYGLYTNRICPMAKASSRSQFQSVVGIKRKILQCWMLILKGTDKVRDEVQDYLHDNALNVDYLFEECLNLVDVTFQVNLMKKWHTTKDYASFFRLNMIFGISQVSGVFKALFPSYATHLSTRFINRLLEIFKATLQPFDAELIRLTVDFKRIVLEQINHEMANDKPHLLLVHSVDVWWRTAFDNFVETFHTAGDLNLRLAILNCLRSTPTNGKSCEMQACFEQIIAFLHRVIQDHVYSPGEGTQLTAISCNVLEDVLKRRRCNGMASTCVKMIMSLEFDRLDHPNCIGQILSLLRESLQISLEASLDVAQYPFQSLLSYLETILGQVKDLRGRRYEHTYPNVLSFLEILIYQMEDLGLIFTQSFIGNLFEAYPHLKSCYFSYYRVVRQILLQFCINKPRLDEDMRIRKAITQLSLRAIDSHNIFYRNQLLAQWNLIDLYLSGDYDFDPMTSSLIDHFEETLNYDDDSLVDKTHQCHLVYVKFASILSLSILFEHHPKLTSDPALHEKMIQVISKHTELLKDNCYYYIYPLSDSISFHSLFHLMQRRVEGLGKNETFIKLLGIVDEFCMEGQSTHSVQVNNIDDHCYVDEVWSSTIKSLLESDV